MEIDDDDDGFVVPCNGDIWKKIMEHMKAEGDDLLLLRLYESV